MSAPKNKPLNSPANDPHAAEGVDHLVPHETLEKLHPSLQESFVPLPSKGGHLTPKQLEAVFAGDLRALRDIARLAYKTCVDAPEY